MDLRAPSYRAAAGPLAIAHRGGAGLAAENTLEAFRRSHALGVRFLETDVRCSLDGRLVAFHDARLGRVTPVRGRVATLPARDLTWLPVLGGGPIVLLADLLAAFPDAYLTIDVKDAAALVPLARLLGEAGATHRVCVAAARDAWLCRLREHAGPELATALGWRALARLASPRRGGAARLIADQFGAAGFAHVPLHLGRVPIFRDDLVARAHDAGVRMIVWTVNDSSTMHRLLDNGVDGIITDRPDLLREVLISRGQWHTPDSYGPAPSLPGLVS